MCLFRKPLKCGTKFRLLHLQTQLFLHSHNFKSPLSNNQEVSCFGNNGVGDEGNQHVGVVLGVWLKKCLKCCGVYDHRQPSMICFSSCGREG